MLSSAIAGQSGEQWAQGVSAAAVRTAQTSACRTVPAHLAKGPVMPAL